MAFVRGGLFGRNSARTAAAPSTVRAVIASSSSVRLPVAASAGTLSTPSAASALASTAATAASRKALATSALGLPSFARISAQTVNAVVAASRGLGVRSLSTRAALVFRPSASAVQATATAKTGGKMSTSLSAFPTSTYSPLWEASTRVSARRSMAQEPGRRVVRRRRAPRTTYAEPEQTAARSAGVPVATERPRHGKEEEEKEHEQRNFYDNEEFGAQEDYITPEVRAHITKTYATLMGAIGVSATSSGAMLMIPGLYASINPMVASLAGLIPAIWLFYRPPENVALKYGLLGAFAVSAGLASGPMIGHYAAVNPTVIVSALAGTTAIFGGFTIAALRAKRGSFLRYGGILGGATLGLLAVQLANAFLPVSATSHSVMTNLSVYGGLGIFTLYVAYDTQAMIERARYGEADHVQDALSLFVDFIAIFRRLLYIFGNDD